jgi:hypothetical protein
MITIPVLQIYGSKLERSWPDQKSWHAVGGCS